MPGQIEAGRTTRGIGSTLDLLPTIADLVDKSLPNDRYYDGISMYQWLFNRNGQSKREINYYWPEDPNPKLGWQQSLHAIRINQWKLHWITAGSHCNNDYADADCRNNATEHVLKQPILFNLYHDVGEKYPVDVTQAYYEDIVNKINESWSNILATDGIFGTSQITMGTNNSYAPCCNKEQNNCYPSANSSWPKCGVCDKVNATFPQFTY